MGEGHELGGADTGEKLWSECLYPSKNSYVEDLLSKVTRPSLILSNQ